MISIDSIQIGHVVTEGDPRSRELTLRQWTTAFYKMPVSGPVKLTPSGLVGDEVADKRHHGGPDKAVLCYAGSHYADWHGEFPELNMSAGALGENLTVAGAKESDVCIGDRYAVGDCEVEISQPRQPCWKIARRHGVKTLTKRVAQTGRTGWYLRVLQGGTLTSGDEMKLTARPNPTWTIARANDVLLGREVDRVAVMELMSLTELADAWKGDLA